MKRILIGTTICASLLLAQSDPSHGYGYEVTPFAAGILTDSKAELKEGNYLNGGIAVAKNLDDSFIDQVEVLYMRSENLRYDNLDSTKANRAFLNAVKKFELTENLAAYGLAGVGYQNITHELKKHEDSAVLNYGIGLKYDIPYYGIALKSDVRHLIPTENGQNDLMYTLGIAMPLGRKEADDINAVVPKVSEPVIEKKAVAPVKLDDDNDGVVNSLDKCPDTSPGVKVNADGCVDTVDLKINFQTNSAVINESYNSNLKKFAETMTKNEKLDAVIEAHTDSVGSDAYNQKLSERRAASAVKALTDLGVNSSKIKAVGHGESQPVASNDDEEGRAENRRVIGYMNQ